MNRIMNLLKQNLPYLDASKSKITLIGFLSLVIFIFLTVFAPFNLSQWGESHFLGYVYIGVGDLLLTQFVLRPLLGFKKIKVFHKPKNKLFLLQSTVKTFPSILFSIHSRSNWYFYCCFSKSVCRTFKTYE